MQYHHPAMAVPTLVLLVALGWASGVAVACTLDNKPSLMVNGIHAVRNPIAPTGVGVWAPFVIDQPFASRAVVRVSELRANLVRTLSSATLAAPFRWKLGDGTVALGHSITHRYTHPGLYQVIVYALDTRARAWFPFDRVLLHIVRPGSLAQSNHALVAPSSWASASALLMLAAGGAVLIIGLKQTVRFFDYRRPHTDPQRGSLPDRRSVDF